VSIERVDHLVLAVESAAAAIETWRAAFGLETTASRRPERTHMEIAEVLLDAGSGGAFLELVQPTDPSHRIARFIAERGEGMFSISMQVDDLDASVAELRGRGLDVSEPEPGVIAGTRVARIPRATAHGVAVQLIERR
jgi:methylmalonyl-CoA/ethylmalonyl-CoA epimerase